MPDATPRVRAATSRDLQYFHTPKLWQTWPFLPVIRCHADGEMDCGVLYDCWTVARRSGFSATVMLTNLFELPKTEDEFLALPKEVYDTVEKMAAAGWRVD